MSAGYDKDGNLCCSVDDGHGCSLKKTKRKVMNECCYDLQHLYELSLEHFQEGCFSCEKLKSRMEKKLGDKVVKSVKRMVKKSPYCEPVSKWLKEPDCKSGASAS